MTSTIISSIVLFLGVSILLVVILLVAVAERRDVV